MNRKGFTLVEALAIITIISILAVVATTSYNAIIKRNKIKECKQAVSYFEATATENVDQIGVKNVEIQELEKYLDVSDTYYTWYKKMLDTQITITKDPNTGMVTSTINYNCEG